MERALTKEVVEKLQKGAVLLYDDGEKYILIERYGTDLMVLGNASFHASPRYTCFDLFYQDGEVTLLIE